MLICDGILLKHSNAEQFTFDELERIYFITNNLRRLETLALQYRPGVFKQTFAKIKTYKNIKLYLTELVKIFSDCKRPGKQIKKLPKILELYGFEKNTQTKESPLDKIKSIVNYFSVKLHQTSNQVRVGIQSGDIYDLLLEILKTELQVLEDAYMIKHDAFDPKNVNKPTPAMNEITRRRNYIKDMKRKSKYKAIPDNKKIIPFNPKRMLKTIGATVHART